MRLSVGLEDVEDLIEDLAQALDAIAPRAAKPRVKLADAPQKSAPKRVAAPEPPPAPAARPARRKREESDLFAAPGLPRPR